VLNFENLWLGGEPRFPHAELDASWEPDNGHSENPCVTVQQHNANMQIVGARPRWLLIISDLARMVDG